MCVSEKQIDWIDTDRQLRETAAEIQEMAHCEAQRKALQISELSLLLPAHVLHALTGGENLALAVPPGPQTVKL